MSLAYQAQRTINNVAVPLAKEGMKLSGWGAPAVLAVSWIAWPGLTPEFKKEVLGINFSDEGSSTTKNGSKSTKFIYAKEEVGKAPTLVSES